MARHISLILGFVAMLLASPAFAQMSGNVDRLKADLHGANIDRAVVAASALGSLKDARAHDALLGALQLGGPPALITALIEAIGLHRDPRAIPLLRHYIRHRNVKIRVAALKALGVLKDPRVIKVFLDSLGDSHPMVRARSARMLGERKIRKAEGRLFKMLKRGDRSAAEPLGQVGGVETARRLAELIGDLPHDTIARAMGAMLKRPDFGPDPLRLQVVKTLGKLPGKEATTALSDYVASVPPKEVRISKRIAEQILAGRK